MLRSKISDYMTFLKVHVLNQIWWVPTNSIIIVWKAIETYWCIFTKYWFIDISCNNLNRAQFRNGGNRSVTNFHSLISCLSVFEIHIWNPGYRTGRNPKLFQIRRLIFWMSGAYFWIYTDIPSKSINLSWQRIGSKVINVHYSDETCFLYLIAQ